MINFWQASILGLLQGISELFPVSSLGHSVIFPKLVGWNINQKDPFFLTFLVATHLATAIVLFVFFYKDWFRIIAGILRSLKEREIRPDDHDARLGWLLVVGTIPAGILGLLFEESFKAFFASASIASVFLICNGFMLFLGEFLRRKREINHSQDTDSRMSKITWPQAVFVGTAQAIALFPGFSRTGATLTGGLMAGLKHEDAARYSFLLATPIIGAAALLKIPELFNGPENTGLGIAIVGAICAGVSAYFSVKFLVKYFKTNTLIPFAIYCICLGLGASLLFFFRG